MSASVTTGASGISYRTGLFALAMAAVIVTASAARLAGLDDLLIWHDEAFTLIRVLGYSQSDVQTGLFNAQLLTPAEVLRFQQVDPGLGWADTWRALAQHPEHAPLYYALGRAAVALPLDPVTALRGTAAVFGLLLPLTVFWLMRELFGRGPVPWVAAALIACSPIHFLYAQEARQYALWMLATVAASAALQPALRRGRRGDWWLYAACVTVGLYAHLLFVVLLPVHAAYAWLVRAKESGSLLRPRGLPARQWLLAVGASLVLFLPWILVLVTRFDRAVHYTAWMERPIGTLQIFAEWGRHLFRAFVDLIPAAPPLPLLILLIPLAWALYVYLRYAPRPAVWLLPLLALAYIGIVLGPDLLFGGSRSGHARYALPAVLSVQLMAAWTIGHGLTAGTARARRIAAGALAVLLAAGGLSIWRIQQAETWWTKNFSSDNAEIARAVNAADRPLVAASPSGVGTGELISVAYHLQPHVRLWGSAADASPALPTGFGDLFLLTPSEALRRSVAPGRRVEPFAGSWQWLRVVAVPKPEPQRTPAQSPHASGAGAGHNRLAGGIQDKPVLSR
jgi:uncharacterized membrane protein